MPGNWEVYDLAADRSESKDLASAHPELIIKAEDLLGREVEENAVFPLTIPGVNGPTR